MHGMEGHAWQEACMVGRGMYGRGVCGRGHA